LEYVAKPDVDVFKAYNEASGNAIKIVSLAPEVEGSEALIAYLTENGIVSSIGHTGAKCADIEKAIAKGASNVTHTYNAQTPLHHREIGTVGSAMLFDELNCELICDTIHVSVPAMRLLVKNKQADKLSLITDAMRAKGIPDGVSELGGQVVYVKNGEARLEDGTLAGSVLRMNRAVQNMVEKVGVPFTQAVDYATINPARMVGIDGEAGSIAVGKRADFTVLNANYDVLCTVVGGKVVYKA
jgi:N-acetylglucosamine-6-phosphate deacetylase